MNCHKKLQYYDWFEINKQKWIRQNNTTRNKLLKKALHENNIK